MIIYDVETFVKIRGSDCSVRDRIIYSTSYTDEILLSQMQGPIIERINSLDPSTYSFGETYSVVRFVFLIIDRLKLKEA